MKLTKFARRYLSIAVAAAMVTPVLSTVAEAVVGTWLSPKPGQPITTRNVEVCVGYNTESGARVTRLELWIDGKFYDKKVLVRPDTRGVCSFWWDTTKTSQGAHDLEVRIFAGNEMIATVSGTGTIGQPGYDLRPPSVRFANIKAGDVLSGTAKIAMAASDDSGQPPIVSLIVDNALKLLTNRPPYVCELDTKQYPDGSHELQSVAYDTAGNKSDPAVVKVAFKNNLEKPVVASMSVNPAPAKPAPSEDDGVGEILPPVSAPAPKAETARSAQPGTAMETPAPTARPTAIVSKPSARPAASVPPAISEPPAKPAAPRSAAVASQPKSAAPTAAPAAARATSAPRATAKVTIAAAEPTVRPATPKVTRPTAAPSSAKPTTVAARSQSPSVREESRATVVASSPSEPSAPAASVAKPREASPRGVAVATKPAGRSTAARVEATASAPAEPKAVAAPERSHARSVAAGTPASPRLLARAVTPAPAKGVEPKSIEKPRTAASHTVPATVQPSGVRSVVAKALPSAGSTAVPPMVPFVGKATPASPGPVRVAMLPSLRGSEPAADTEGTIVNPPVPSRETRAKLEKRTVLASGTVKLRELFDQLGGVLFWDPENHSVTGYLNGLMVEMWIGNNVMKVNGDEVRADHAPIVVDGRTLIDAAVFQRICEQARVDLKQALAE